jgi:2-amino-4-hydroxy-6-hydroxymethyldihydropteridine diphosphokinase
MAEVFIAVGSNLGDREDNLRRALEALAPAVTVRDRSTVHETAPQYVTDQPPFLNMVLRGETALAPHDLLAWLKDIERRIGRTPSRRFGPRVVDLDILYYEDQIVNDAVLQIPHPRISERLFVLNPLSEIAADRRHPITSDTTTEMLKRLILRNKQDVPNCRD